MSPMVPTCNVGQCTKVGTLTSSRLSPATDLAMIGLSLHLPRCRLVKAIAKLPRTVVVFRRADVDEDSVLLERVYSLIE